MKPDSRGQMTMAHQAPVRGLHRWLRGAIAFLFCASTASIAVRAQVNDAALSNESNTSEWLTYGRTYTGQRFSPLDQVNASNVNQLGVDWYVDLPGETGIQSTPLVADGVMYFRTSKDLVYAVKATSGERLWKYDPDIAARITDGKHHPELFYLHGGRGLALWEDKLFTATVDGRLVALDPHTGKELWAAQVLDPRLAQYIVGAPIAFHGKVVVGVAGTEMGARRGADETEFSRGFVTAYDAQSGKKVWHFFTVPGDPAKGFESKAMAMAAKTWPAGWWKFGGGGHAWGEGFNYDPELNLLMFNTGNPNPLPRKARGAGDCLFTDSVVAVDADTGAYRWHYQLNPGEQWGWDAVTPMIRADLAIDGRTVKAIMLFPKNGFFYVIDRTNGKLVSAEPYTRQNWASKIDLKTGRPVELPGVDYSKLGKASIWPGASGGHSWEAISYNPRTGLLYTASHDQGTTIELSGRHFEGQGIEGFSYYNMLGTGLEAKGVLQAWDPVRQKRVWEVPMPGPIGPGTLTTAGNLVFHGQADGELAAFNAATGAKLWHYPLGLGITSPPITYSIGDKQYVAQLIGYGSSHTGFPEAKRLGYPYRVGMQGMQTRRLIVFSLAGKVTLPPQPPPSQLVPVACPTFKSDPALAKKAEGSSVACGLCHGGSLAPDLTASPIVCNTAAFLATVHEGRPAMRMPALKDWSDEDLIAIQNLIRQRAEGQLAALATPSTNQ